MNNKKKSEDLFNISPHDYKKFLACIIDAYDSGIIRAYSKIRFNIININILHILGLCLRDKRRVLELGCGFGLCGCYFSALYPEIEYIGYDINARRIALAQEAGKRLGLHNVSFHCKDARELSINDQYDAILMIDLLHHIDENSKKALLSKCSEHLISGGRLIIKDVTTHPFLKLAFTWALDVVMTRGFDLDYWNEEKFFKTLGEHFNRVDTFPIADWMPYPHIIYLSENESLKAGSAKTVQ